MRKILLMPLLVFMACKSENKKMAEATSQDYSIEYITEEGKKIINEGAKVEVVGKGFTWTEGPLWVEQEQMLLFSDVPENKVYKWRDGEGVSVYLEPSGLTNDLKHTGEMGSNGLMINDEGELVLCQHGNRAVAIMDSDLKNPTPKYKFLVEKYQNKKINSPNDIIQAKNGDYFFTDPDYGISKNDKKEQEANRVYHLTKTGDLKAIIDTISHPNGLAFSPNEEKLYVTNSNPEKAFLYEYQLDKDKKVLSGKVLYDFRKIWKEGQATPDGVKVDEQGNVFVAAPGGIWVFDQKGDLQVKIHTAKKSSNNALSKDGKTLYITNSDKVLRLRMR